MTDGRLMSWSADRTLRFWKPDGTPLARHLFWYDIPIDVQDNGSYLTVETDGGHGLVRCYIAPHGNWYKSFDQRTLPQLFGAWLKRTLTPSASAAPQRVRPNASTLGDSLPE
jgi:hypothetical protein